MNTHGSKWIRPTKRLAIYLRDEFTCAYCTRNLHGVTSADVTLDHLVPRCAGGTNEAYNLVTACRRCNSSRKDLPWYQFADPTAFDRVVQLIQRPLNTDLAKAIIAGLAGAPELETNR